MHPEQPQTVGQLEAQGFQDDHLLSIWSAEEEGSGKIAGGESP